MNDDADMDEYDLAERRWEQSHAELLATRPVVVRVERWKAGGWKWWSRGGFSLYVYGLGVRGPTQTYRTRSMDAAREMVIDYICCGDVVVPDDMEICWVDNGK